MVPHQPPAFNRRRPQIAAASASGLRYRPWFGAREHLRGAGGVALPVVEAAGAEVAGVVTGVDRGGRWSSGEGGRVVPVHGGAS